jgi:hypothetical protein
MIFVGCDPGLSGGFAIIDSGGCAIESFPMPLSAAKKIDPRIVWESLHKIEKISIQYFEPIFFGIEKVITLPADVDNIIDRIAEIESADAVARPGAIARAREACHKRDGRVGVLKIGINFGIILGAMASYNWRYAIIPPRTWQAELWVGSDKNLDSKNKTYQICRQLWPQYDFRVGNMRRDFHDGITDAFGIAEYCRRTYGKAPAIAV